MLAREHRDAVGPDLVRDVAVPRDAVGADEDEVDAAAAQDARRHAVRDHRDVDPGPRELPSGQARALEQRPGLVGEHGDLLPELRRAVDRRERRPAA